MTGVAPVVVELAAAVDDPAAGALAAMLGLAELLGPPSLAASVVVELESHPSRESSSSGPPSVATSPSTSRWCP